MKRLSLVVAVLAIAGASGNANASEGFYDQYGYQTPNKYTRPATQAKTQPSKIFSLETPANASKKKKNYSAAQGGNMSGGARPSIAPTTPPKVNFHSGYGAGQIVIDQSARKLYYTVSSSKAYMYPIAVGKEGFKWTGTQKISKKVDWPDWRPPAEMRERKPNLPVSMTGGVYNPLGAKALYLGNTLYRIHGTNDPKSIGTAASSGCIRMYNGHVVHLSSMAGVGTTVHVVSRLPKTMASN